MLRSIAALSSLLLLGLAPSLAWADDEDVSTAITFSPFHLIMPVVEVTAEFKAGEKVGVAVIGGGGSVLGYTTIELGGQARYYALGDFADGLLVGGEVLIPIVTGNGATATGVSVGPMIGGKTTFDFGLVLDGQIGVAYSAIGASATSGGETATSTASGIGPILNLNLGWAF